MKIYYDDNKFLRICVEIYHLFHILFVIPNAIKILSHKKFIDHMMSDIKIEEIESFIFRGIINVFLIIIFEWVMQ